MSISVKKSYSKSQAVRLVKNLNFTKDPTKILLFLNNNVGVMCEVVSSAL